MTYTELSRHLIFWSSIIMAFGVTVLILVALKALSLAFTGTDKPYIPESVGAEAKPEYRAVEESKLKTSLFS